MTKEFFDENCKGCQPILINVRTGLPYHQRSPVGRAVLHTWQKFSHDEKLTFHRVTCLGSTSPADIEIMADLSYRIGRAAREAELKSILN